MNEQQCLLQECDEQSRRYAIIVVLVLMHVRFLSEHKRRMLKTYIIVRLKKDGGKRNLYSKESQCFDPDTHLIRVSIDK